MLIYNPYGKRDYYMWLFPANWFDMGHNSCVLIDKELRNLIGGSGTHKLFVSELKKLEEGYKECIYRYFLGIESPKGFHKET